MEDQNNNTSDNIWIFAYGSLCWRPGFAYDEIRTGHVNGFLRRFWQGNIVHRGSASKPGRVATLVPSENGQTWGCAYRIKRNQLSILEYLENREMKLGGYVCVWTAFFPHNVSTNTKTQSSNNKQKKSNNNGNNNSGKQKQSRSDEDEEEDDDDEEEVEDVDMTVDEVDVSIGFPCLCYVALEGNSLWLGEETELSIASQVRDAYGNCGPNIDYVLNLYKYMKTTFPYLKDQHLEDIVKHL